MQEKSLYNMNAVGLESAVSTNKVLKNTYMLLGLTLLFSAVTAGISMAMGLGQGAALILCLVGFGLLFVVNRTADSSTGLLAIFGFTGVMGAAIGPMLNYYLSMPGGPALVMQARSAMARRRAGDMPWVMATKIGVNPMGSMITKSVVKAAIRAAKSNMPRA